jgi:hypothetical protein
MHAPTRPSWLRLGPLTVVAVSGCLALVSAVVAHGTVKPVAAASTHVFVDTAPPSVVHRPEYPISALIDRAELLGRVVTSPPVVGQIERRAGVPAGQLAAEARTTAGVPDAFKEPGSEERANAIPIADRRYRIEVEARPLTPVLDIYAHAPTTAAAVRLSDAAVAALQQRLSALGDDEGVPASDRVVLRQLGASRGGIVNGGMAAAIGAITFLLVLALALVAARYGRRRRTARALSPRDASHADDAWPHTTRLMPWMFAVFLTMVWLVPFDKIILNVPTPFGCSPSSWAAAWRRACAGQ